MKEHVMRRCTTRGTAAKAECVIQAKMQVIITQEVTPSAPPAR
jgi:hypothetical protein